MLSEYWRFFCDASPAVSTIHRSSVKIISPSNSLLYITNFYYYYSPFTIILQLALRYPIKPDQHVVKQQQSFQKSKNVVCLVHIWLIITIVNLLNSSTFFYYLHNKMLMALFSTRIIYVFFSVYTTLSLLCHSLVLYDKHRANRFNRTRTKASYRGVIPHQEDLFQQRYDMERAFKTMMDGVIFQVTTNSAPKSGR